MARTEGSRNNVTADCKQSIMSVYNELGGAKGLLKWASRNNDNQTEFYKMLVKILPKDIDLTIAEKPQLIIQQHVTDNPEVASEAASSLH